METGGATTTDSAEQQKLLRSGLPDELSWKPIPGVICPKCGREGTTTVEGYPGACSYLAMVGCCMMGCVCGCCLIPLHLDSCQDLSHQCNKPSCKHEIGVYSRLFGSSVHEPPFPGVEDHKDESMESPIT